MEGGTICDESMHEVMLRQKMLPDKTQEYVVAAKAFRNTGDVAQKIREGKAATLNWCDINTLILEYTDAAVQFPDVSEKTVGRYRNRPRG